MSEAEAKLILRYVVVLTASFIAGAVTALLPELAKDPSVPINLRAIVAGGLGTFLTAFLATGLASGLPRRGSADLANQVDALRADGAHRSDMTVTDDHRPTPSEQRLDPPEFLARADEERRTDRLD